MPLSTPCSTSAQVQHSAALATAPARGFATSVQAPTTKSDIDWEELEKSAASDNGKRELQLLRSTFLDVQQKLGDMTKVLRSTPTSLFSCPDYASHTEALAWIAEGMTRSPAFERSRGVRPWHPARHLCVDLTPSAFFVAQSSASVP